jgi:hypothetical protein
MVYRFRIDGVDWGEFFYREEIHNHLVGEGWSQIAPGSDGYSIRVNGIVTGIGEVVLTLPYKQISELPKF